MAVSSTPLSGPITVNNVSPAPLPSFAVQDVTRNESDGTLSFTITKMGTTSLQSSVHFDTLSGSALAGVDFIATSGDLVFSEGETTKTVTVSLVNDALIEPTESFSLKLSGAVNATISKGAATGTIIDNDTLPS